MTTIFDIHPEWEMGKDGLPINKKADPYCLLCKGHGVVEDGELSLYSSVLINCKCTEGK